MWPAGTMNVLMRAWNRAKLLWGYLARRAKLGALPVEYIVETTAKCNLYCPMCPRETHKQPKADMTDQVFERLVREAGTTARAHDADRPGRALHGPADFRANRILRPAQRLHTAFHQWYVSRRTHRRAGSGLAAGTHHLELRWRFEGDVRVLPQGRQIRKGPRQLRPLRPHETPAPVPVCRWWCRWSGWRATREVDDFMAFWSAIPGVDQVRIKADETNLMRPDAGHAAADWKHPCHYLWRGAMYVKQDGRRVSVLPELHARRRAAGRISRSSRCWTFGIPMRCSECGACTRPGEAAKSICAPVAAPRSPIRRWSPGSLVLHGKTVRRLLPMVERLTYLSKLPARLLRPPQRHKN